MQDNLKAKFGITDEELKSGIDTIAKNIGKICKVNIALAVCELLTSGDISPTENDK